MQAFYQRVQVRNWFISILLASLLILLFLLPRNPGPYRAVPEHVSLLLEFNGMLKAGKQTAAISDPVWKKLLTSHVFSQCWTDVGIVENLFHDHPAYKRAFAFNKLVAAFTLNPADSLQPLFVLDLNEDLPLEDWLKSRSIRYFPYQFHGQTLFTVHLPNQTRLVFAQKNRQLLYSRYSYLVEDGISQLERPRSWWSHRKLLRDLAPESPMRCFFRPDQWMVQYGGTLHPAMRSSFQTIASNLQWVGIAWDGKSPTMGCESAGFLSQMAKWNGAAPTRILKYLPNHAAAVAWAGFDNRRLFFESLFSGNHADFDHFILPWVDGDVAMVITEPLSPALQDDRLLLVGVSQEAKAISSLEAYGETRGSIARDRVGMFEIFGFQNGAFLSPFFPNKEQAFLTPYCAVMGEYAVFAPNRPALELFLEKYISNQTLAQSPELLQMSTGWDRQERGLFWVNGGYLSGIVQQIFSGKTPPAQQEIGDLGAAGLLGFKLQPTATQLVTIEPSAQALNTPLPSTDIYWKAPLPSPVATGVFEVAQPGMDQGMRLLVQDQQSDLFCFQPDGVEAWRRRIGGSLMSPVVGVDYFESGRQCYVFNTSSEFWMLDENGKNVQGFPIKLSSAAIAAMSLVDFDKNKRPCYFIPCANGYIYGFDWNGRPLEGWNPLSSAGVCPFPIAHFQFQGKDFLGALNNQGQLTVMGRDGKLRFPSKMLEGKFYSPPGIGKLSGKPHFVCLNESGNLITCSPDGKLTVQPKVESFGSIAPLKFAVHPLGIAAVQGKKIAFLKSVNQGYKLAFSKQLTDNQSDIFWTDSQIGLYSADRKKINLLDASGQVLKGFPLAGSSTFVAIQANGHRFLVTGNGSAVYAYKLNSD